MLSGISPLSWLSSEICSPCLFSLNDRSWFPDWVLLIVPLWFLNDETIKHRKSYKGNMRPHTRVLNGFYSGSWFETWDMQSLHLKGTICRIPAFILTEKPEGDSDESCCLAWRRLWGDIRCVPNSKMLVLAVITSNMPWFWTPATFSISAPPR